MFAKKNKNEIVKSIYRIIHGMGIQTRKENSNGMAGDSYSNRSVEVQRSELMFIRSLLSQPVLFFLIFSLLCSLNQEENQNVRALRMSFAWYMTRKKIRRMGQRE